MTDKIAPGHWFTTEMKQADSPLVGVIIGNDATSKQAFLNLLEDTGYFTVNGRPTAHEESDRTFLQSPFNRPKHIPAAHLEKIQAAYAINPGNEGMLYPNEVAAIRASSGRPAVTVKKLDEAPVAGVSQPDTEASPKLTAAIQLLQTVDDMGFTPAERIALAQHLLGAQTAQDAAITLLTVARRNPHAEETPGMDAAKVEYDALLGSLLKARPLKRG